MVRLETFQNLLLHNPIFAFTFQYGQIRNCLVYSQSYRLNIYLHSSMVRLETFNNQAILWVFLLIYIPVWLDQKLHVFTPFQLGGQDLHSSMVRLETKTKRPHYHVILLFTFQYGQIRNLWHMLLEHTNYDIYIPVWLDQKLR